ncbi:hypothetical protein EVAR_82221_1 [Eumeta japonica]|uniref:Uncharacterized protein n=1 Tax=Eumeta variegata TaxID=151549 RepID=A0A4C1W6P8_EUMVA|nr:hypothetical protein EVAR_82221_1 [Eumeta japonica]
MVKRVNPILIRSQRSLELRHSEPLTHSDNLSDRLKSILRHPSWPTLHLHLSIKIVDKWANEHTTHQLEEVVNVAYTYSQPQSSHQHVYCLWYKNRISNGGEWAYGKENGVMEREWGDREGIGPRKTSLIGRNATVEVVISRLCFWNKFGYDRTQSYKLDKFFYDTPEDMVQDQASTKNARNGVYGHTAATVAACNVFNGPSMTVWRGISLHIAPT